MCWTYVLKSRLNGKFYIGSTNDLERRVKQHLAGKTRTTKVLQAFDLVYSEEYDSILKARLRGKKLKLYKSHKYIEWLISKGQ